MDTVSLIITAIIAGLTSGISETTSFAIKDGYEKLKNSLLAIAGTRTTTIQKSLSNLESDPSSDIWRNILQEELLKLKITENDELLSFARSLEALTKKMPNSPGKYSVSIDSSSGIVIGDYSKVNQEFSQPKKSKKPKIT